MSFSHICVSISMNNNFEAQCVIYGRQFALPMMMMMMISQNDITLKSVYFLFCFSNTLHINGFHNTRCDCVAFAPQIHNKYKLFIIIITNSVPNAAIYSIAFYACVCVNVCASFVLFRKNRRKKTFNFHMFFVVLFCCDFRGSFTNNNNRKNGNYF